MEPQLLIERNEGTLVLTISNPERRNALAPAIYQAGIAALGAAQLDTSVSAVVLTGAGATFCSGGNLTTLLANRERDPEVQGANIDLLGQFVTALRGSVKPVIAAVEGIAAGAGLSLVLACDMIVATHEARFVMSHVRVGLSPDGGGTWSLARLLPRQLAFELAVLGEPVAASRLAQAGVVNVLAAPGSALEDALALGEKLARLAAPAIAAIKGLITQAGEPEATLAVQLALERASFLGCLYHPNGQEGIAAFLEKRPPIFRS